MCVCLCVCSTIFMFAGFALSTSGYARMTFEFSTLTGNTLPRGTILSAVVLNVLTCGMKTSHFILYRTNKGRV